MKLNKNKCKKAQNRVTKTWTKIWTKNWKFKIEIKLKYNKRSILDSPLIL